VKLLEKIIVRKLLICSDPKQDYYPTKLQE
jgi:hypothetical protein